MRREEEEEERARLALAVAIYAGFQYSSLCFNLCALFILFSVNAISPQTLRLPKQEEQNPPTSLLLCSLLYTSSSTATVVLVSYFNRETATMERIAAHTKQQ